jgi:predicted hydrocarbon binding protein
MTRHTEKWVKNLMTGLDEHVDEETCRLILERCGRECITKNVIEKAREVYSESEDLEEFLKNYSQVNRHLHLEDDGVYLVYPRCYCPTVKNMRPGQLSATYCDCSRGWAKALFEGATGRKVEVVREKSVVNGDGECRFRIIL